MSARRSDRSARGRRAQKATERQSELPLESAAESELEPCPRCGKSGKFRDAGAGRFPWFVQFEGCVWATDHVRNRLVAVKLWNEAKPVPDEHGRRKA